MREAQASIEDLQAFDDSNALARAWRLVSLVHGVSGRYEACGAANEKAIEYARRAGDRVMEKRLYATASLVLVLGPTPAPTGIAGCESLIEVGEGERRAQAVTFGGLAHLRAMVGDFERARDDYRRARAILEELGLRFDAALISIDSGPVELLAGDPVAAEAELRQRARKIAAPAHEQIERRHVAARVGGGGVVADHAEDATEPLVSTSFPAVDERDLEARARQHVGKPQEARHATRHLHAPRAARRPG